MREWTLIFLGLLLIGSTNCKKKDGKKKMEMEKYKMQNICENENPEVLVSCKCDSNTGNTASDAHCWIFAQDGDTKLPPWAHFSSQTDIKHLKLSFRTGTNSYQFPTEVAQHLRRLEEWEIQYAIIPEIKANALANSSHLKELSLMRNSISVLHPNAFSHLQTLEHLNLDDNKIFEIQPMVFHHVPNLRRLFISRNNLSIVHDNAFRFLNHLHELELNSNMISIITRETFNGLFRLRRLILTANKLTMLGDYTFAEMPELEELELDQNDIKFISENAFAMLGELKKLRLQENKLQVLSDGIFEHSRSIQFLDLRDNSLDILNYETLKPLWENFKNSTAHLMIDGNMFPCDCHLYWVYSLAEETTNKQILESLKDLTCIVSGDMVATEEPLLISEQQDDQYSSNGVEYEDEDEDVEYEELPEEGGPLQQFVLKIRREALPCPETLQAQTEVPTSDENSSRESSSNASRIMFINFYLLALFTVKTAFLT